jgi:deoxyribodipyrimidine photo-lyase
VSAVSPSGIPHTRIRPLNTASINPAGQFVLYWMTSARRLRSNFALQRAVEIAQELRRPLVILEALRCDYPHANDRLHRFVLDGMADNARVVRSRALYYPYVEPRVRDGRGLIAALSTIACAIVADWYPAFFLPRMLSAAAEQSRVRLEAIDSNGIVPLADHGAAFTTARSYRAFVQRSLRTHLAALPHEDPLGALRGFPKLANLPRDIRERWPAADLAALTQSEAALAALPIDHGVPPAPARGGATTAARLLKHFIAIHLEGYFDRHNHPDADGTSRLSPYLHFGHISAHDVFSAVMTHERWTTRRLVARGGGAREGWWGVSPSAEVFLDQLVVWRELSFNGCEYIQDFTSYGSLPEWARLTLEKHLTDKRPHLYSLRQLEEARTHDDVWNAAQRQLVAEGWFHSYLRMLWGKNILTWCKHPSQALGRMQALMDRYSLDGRDPNSYAGYTWVLGRYDRPWPERPIVGTVRAMTSASARRKLKMQRFLAQYGAPLR